jgi:hypothetical protein
MGGAGTAGQGGAGQNQGGAGAAGQGGAGTGGQGGAAGQGSGTLHLNDVSILFPLGDQDDLFQATDMGAKGQLLPLAYASQVGPIALVPGEGVGAESPEPMGTTHGRLRVVAARLDPCFPSLAGASCRRQVRFVFQPWTAQDGCDDSALHVFYDISAEELSSLFAEIAALNAASGVATDGPLAVHPALVAQGMSGAFASGLRAALLARIGAGAITRVTAMQLKLTAGAWDFHGLDFDASGNSTPIGMLGTSENVQHLAGFGNTGFSSTVSPIFPEDSDFSLFWDSDKTKAASPSEQQKAFDAALTAENPTLRDVDHVSCVLCHTAGPARGWASQHLGLSAAGNPAAFVAPGLDLTVTTAPTLAGLTNQFRAFGYNAKYQVISQRTVNDSAAVVTFLNAAAP